MRNPRRIEAATRPRRLGRTIVVLAALFLGARLGLTADDAHVITVRTGDELRKAVAAAVPGTWIEVAAGTYENGFAFTDLRGAPGRPVVIAAKDPAHPPVFHGAGAGIQLTDPQHVELEGLTFEGQTGNGLNVDDGGTPATPASHVVLRRIVVRNVGPAGNHDGIKLSGVEDFRVEDCTVERWGTGGSAIDMVGCRRGAIEACVFRHSESASGASGVQAKGGTRDVTIRRSRFENAGGRAVNAGGSTGLEYFRPPLAEWKGPKYEAKDIRVEGNTFIGSETSVAFVGVDGAVFRFNTLYIPRRWAARVLQETRAEGFVPCRNGEFTDNLVVFRSDAWSEGGVNCGPGTEPESFKFARNFWFCSDAPSRTRELVRLPVPEKGGVYGEDPKFRDAEHGDVRLRDGSPAAKAGAEALKD